MITGCDFLAILGITIIGAYLVAIFIHVRTKGCKL
jgi:hypothetical protein